MDYGVVGNEQKLGKLALCSNAHDLKAQVTALQLIIGILRRTRLSGVENIDTLL